ncbi:hypothetical protein [Brevibacillus laterosporus]|uniref:hypothetical protein n=1 Tax=Brevibacillus laterosporus TaxID=1465 RepID=UPI001A7E406A|nr:hypothetical protein [Brevibacillus laterosporus]
MLFIRCLSSLISQRKRLSAEKVKIGDNEAAYTTMKRSDGEMHKRISWIKNGTSLGYSVWTFSKDITKEDLIKVARTLQKAK